MKKIFISHASKDSPIMQAFIDEILIGALSVKITEIFCTTTDGTKIISGSDWRNSIRDALITSKITFLIVTPNYKESEVSLCEMGAAWVSSGVVIPLIVEPINFSTVGIIQQPKQVERLLDEKSLDRIRDLVQEHLTIPPSEIKSDRWTAKKYEFIAKVTKISKESPFPIPLSREDFDKAVQAKIDIKHAMQLIIEDKNNLEILIEEIKKTKNSADVKIIEAKFKDCSLFDEFSTMCSEVTSNLSRFPSIIIGIIYSTFSGKDINIEWRSWKEQLDDAIARDYINEDLDPNWTTTKAMRNLNSSLTELNNFIHKNSENASFLVEYEEKFEAPPSVANLDFWEEAFSVKVYLS